VTDDAEEMETLTKHNSLVKRQLCLTYLKKAVSIRIKSRRWMRWIKGAWSNVQI